MRERTIENQVRIAVPAQQAFAYVTRPERWHEWHPASEGATVAAASLHAGATFSEAVGMRPFGLLPIRMRRRLDWTVTAMHAPNFVSMQGQSTTIDVRLAYRIDGGEITTFHRTFHYTIKGWLGVFDALFVLPRMRKQSALALANLKRRLEQGVL